MFRMPPQVDPAEEKKRVQADVRNNILMFTVLCAAIRLGKKFMQIIENWKLIPILLYLKLPFALGKSWIKRPST